MSRSEGYKDEIVGAIKENVGWAIGNEKMEAEGKAQKLKGDGEVESAKAQQQVKGAGEQLKGNVKEGAGKLLGNQQMELEGKGDKLKGEAREKLNQ